MKRSLARHIPLALCCIIWLLLAAGCTTPAGVERVDAGTTQRELTANALTAGELSPSARNVLRRWVLSERYDDDSAGAIAALHTIVTDGRGHEDEVITLAEMAYLYAERTHQRPYFLGAAIYSFAFLFPEPGLKLPSTYDPRLRLAADLYNLGIIHAFAAADDTTVEFKSGNYQAPFGWVQVVADPSGFEWHNRRVVALTPVQEVAVRGLANRYAIPGLARRSLPPLSRWSPSAASRWRRA